MDKRLCLSADETKTQKMEQTSGMMMLRGSPVETMCWTLLGHVNMMLLAIKDFSISKRPQSKGCLNATDFNKEKNQKNL